MMAGSKRRGVCSEPASGAPRFTADHACDIIGMRLDCRLGDAELKRLFLFAASFLIAVCTSCGFNRLAIDSAIYKIQEIKTNSPSIISLRVTGLVMDSAFYVDRIETETDNMCLIIKVHEKFVSCYINKTNRTGSFDYSLDVPPEIDYVCYGTAQNVIWNRSIGFVRKARIFPPEIYLSARTNLLNVHGIFSEGGIVWASFLPRPSRARRMEGAHRKGPEPWPL